MSTLKNYKPCNILFFLFEDALQYVCRVKRIVTLLCERSQHTIYGGRALGAVCQCRCKNQDEEHKFEAAHVVLQDPCGFDSL